MDKIEQTTKLPPEIRSNFDKALLSRPIPQFSDSSEDFFAMYLFIKDKTWKKLKKRPGQLKKAEMLEEQFKDLYERAKAKEKDFKEKNQKLPMFTYASINSTKRSHHGLYRFIRSKSLSYKKLILSSGHNNEFL